MEESILHPAVQKALDENKITYEVLECDPNLADTAAFCEHYGFSESQAANTILVASRKVEPTKYAVCVVLATSRLDVNKQVCKLLGVKKASFADAEATIKLTDMMIGGVTAFGTTDLPIYVDAAVIGQKQVVMGGGNRSSKITLDPKELEKLKDVQVVDELAKPKQ